MGDFEFFLDLGRNHASVVDQDSAVYVIKWIPRVEEKMGDLK